MPYSRINRLHIVLACLFVFATAGIGVPLGCGSGKSSGESSPLPSETAASPSPAWSPTMAPAHIPVVKPGDELPAFATLKAMFAYDKTEPLGFRSTAAEPQRGCTVDAVWFNCGGNTAAGYLVMPEGDGPFPVLIYAPGWRCDVKGFLPDAVDLAQDGYAGLLLQEPDWTSYFTYKAASDIEAAIQYVTQTRRAVDLLETLPRVDAGRVGYVGWSNGGNHGALVPGVDHRIRAYVLMGASSTTVYDDVAKKTLGPSTGPAFKHYAVRMSIVDQAAYLRHGGRAAYFFVNGEDDKEAMRQGPAFMRAAGDHGTWKVFDGGHWNTDRMFELALPWLKENL